MERIETNKIINKITTFRQSFLVKKDTVAEWHKILKDYDYNDVDSKLDDYFKESKNFGQFPDPYYLTKYLTKTKDKFSMENIVIHCSLCGEIIPQEKYQDHYDRCSSADYVYRMYKKYYNKIINKEEIKKLPDEQFDKMYWQFCDNLYKIIPDGLEKKCLENAIRSHKGLEINYSLDNIIQEI